VLRHELLLSYYDALFPLKQIYAMAARNNSEESMARFVKIKLDFTGTNNIKGRYVW